jgi:hypothetical protein
MKKWKRRLLMTLSRLGEIRPGWKVFAGPDEVGEVVDLGDEDIEVRRGTLIRHTYRIPNEYIAQVGEGIVDLTIDSDAVEALERHEGDDLPRGGGDPPNPRDSIDAVYTRR